MSMSGSPRPTTTPSSRTACIPSSARYCRKHSASSRPNLRLACSMSSTPGPSGIPTDFSISLLCNVIALREPLWPRQPPSPWQTRMMATPEQKKSIRSDDDEWDIVSSVGYTALLVAGWRALHAMSAQPLARDDYAQHFITASGDPYLTSVLLNPGTS